MPFKLDVNLNENRLQIRTRLSVRHPAVTSQYCDLSIN